MRAVSHYSAIRCPACDLRTVHALAETIRSHLPLFIQSATEAFGIRSLNQTVIVPPLVPFGSSLSTITDEMEQADLIFSVNDLCRSVFQLIGLSPTIRAELFLCPDHPFVLISPRKHRSGETRLVVISSLQSKVKGSMFRLLWTFMAAGIVARGFRSRLNGGERSS